MIVTSFLTDVANYTNGRITKVVLNEIHEITPFEVKEIVGSTVYLEYLIPSGLLSVITLIELRDASDTVISSNIVNVPVTSDVLIKQRIEIKEDEA